MESLSAYARQFLERMEKPDVDRTRACAGDRDRQKNSIRNPRSTVGTTTEIHDTCGCCSRAWAAHLPAGGTDVVRETAEIVAGG